MTPVSFEDSKSAKEQREMRAIIRRIKKSILTNSEREILMAVVNLWFHHRNGPEGVIRPGREKLARRVDVSVKTVSRTLDKFRKAGVMIPVKYANGGCKATRYTVDLLALLQVYYPSGVEELPGILGEIYRSEPGHCDAENSEIELGHFGYKAGHFVSGKKPPVEVFTSDVVPPDYGCEPYQEIEEWEFSTQWELVTEPDWLDGAL